MARHYVSIEVESVELIGDSALSTDELARACARSIEWVSAHVEEGLLQGERHGDQWRFGALALLRARRIAHLEGCFDADPQLAALTADLIEEVAQLRRQLAALGKLPERS